MDTVYSENLKDPWVHHPEQGCHHRQTIIENGNDETGWVPAHGQALPVYDGDLNLRLLTECRDCTTIQVRRDLGLDN